MDRLTASLAARGHAIQLLNPPLTAMLKQASLKNAEMESQFEKFAPPVPERSEFRKPTTAAYRLPEKECVPLGRRGQVPNDLKATIRDTPTPRAKLI